METINNFYGTNQFILIRNNNLKTLINLKDVSEIFVIKNILTIKKNDGKSFTEVFETENDCEKFFKYTILSISEGDRVISRNIFEDMILKDNKMFGD